MGLKGMETIWKQYLHSNCYISSILSIRTIDHHFTFPAVFRWYLSHLSSFRRGFESATSTDSINVPSCAVWCGTFSSSPANPEMVIFNSDFNNLQKSLMNYVQEICARFTLSSSFSLQSILQRTRSGIDKFKPWTSSSGEGMIKWTSCSGESMIK